MKIRTDRIAEWMTGITLLDEDDEIMLSMHVFDTDTGQGYHRDGSQMDKVSAWAVCCSNDEWARKARMCMPKELHHRVIVVDFMDLEGVKKSIRAVHG